MYAEQGQVWHRFYIPIFEVVGTGLYSPELFNMEDAGSGVQSNEVLRAIAAVQIAEARTPKSVRHPGGVARSLFAMGTIFTVYLANEDTEQSEACFNLVVEEIDRLENTFSRFRPQSEISRINALAAEQPVVTDPEVFQLLASALGVSRNTFGAFDITVGPLTRAWGFASKQGRVPSAKQLESALQTVGWTNVVLDPTWRTVSFLKSGVELDLGGIAKGYAVDRALELLRDAHVPAVIDVGSSSIAATGIPAGHRGWKVLVADPADRTRAVAELELRDRALSTSGACEQCFAKDGRTYCHLIDPRSGDAATHILQVTVLAPNSTLADALSTAMFILGPQKGIPVLNRMPGCSALWVGDSGGGTKNIGHEWPTSE